VALHVDGTRLTDRKRRCDASTDVDATRTASGQRRAEVVGAAPDPTRTVKAVAVTHWDLLVAKGIATADANVLVRGVPSRPGRPALVRPSYIE
jgi:hypothetical protein